MYQQTVSAISQISFSADESVTPKKPTSIAEVAKQRELSGTLQSESEAKMKKQLSDAKCKELSGHDIFAPPSEISPKPLTAQNLEMKGNDIGESTPRNSPPSTKVSSVSEMMHKLCTFFSVNMPLPFIKFFSYCLCGFHLETRFIIALYIIVPPLEPEYCC